MLLIVAHPVVGPGLETILRLERFDVRRVARPGDVASVLPWTPDIALIDGILLMDGGIALGIPSLILSGSAFDGEPLRPRLDDARGWLRKDATAEELVSAIGRVVGAQSPRARLGRGVVVAVVAATGAAVFLALGMLVARVAG